MSSANAWAWRTLLGGISFLEEEYFAEVGSTVGEFESINTRLGCDESSHADAGFGLVRVADKKFVGEGGGDQSKDRYNVKVGICLRTLAPTDWDNPYGIKWPLGMVPLVPR
jgi:hypothetical protein